MENRLFKHLIEENVKKLGFEKLKTSFFKESEDALVFLIPRKSGYSNTYYLRMKVELKPIKADFDRYEFIKHDVANITMSVDGDNRELFDLENGITDLERTRLLEEFFKTKVAFWVNKMLNKESIIELYQKENFFLLPNTRSKLGIE